jgi:cytochrome b pre-mRNA-processing protein 3
LNSLKRLLGWGFQPSNSEKLYGAIVAQARLPAFYRELGIPDSLEGRFGLLALNLFTVLHALAAKEGAQGLTQSLVDQFSRDMETVLRELGVSDIAVPKRMRALAGSTRGIVVHYEEAMAPEGQGLAAAIAETLPMAPETKDLTSRRLASYVEANARLIAPAPLAALEAGEIAFAPLPETA